MTQEEIEVLKSALSNKNMFGELLMNIDVEFIDQEVFGDKQTHTLNFDVWDGYAYCYDYEGKEYEMTYPKKSLINLSPEMTKTIKTNCELGDDDKIEIIHILTTYNVLKCVN